MPFKFVLGGLALSVVSGLRQKAALDSNHGAAVHIVDSMSALIHNHDFAGVQSLIEELAQQTPGAGASYKDTLNKAIKAIEDDVEQKIKDGQSATQVKIENEIEKYETANEAAVQSKAGADQADRVYFQCVAKEQKAKEELEQAEARVADSKSKEAKACQLQEDNKGFSVWPEVVLGFSCDHSVAGSCSEQYSAFSEKLKKIDEEAKKSLSEDQAEYQKLKGSCDRHRAESIAAESALRQAFQVFSNQSSKCRDFLASRDQAVCGFASSVQAKCAEEQQFKATIAGTQERNGDMHSEVDRKQEWMAAFTTKCMLGKAVAKGLMSGPVTAQDLLDCTEMANYRENVGELKTYAAKAKALTDANACSEMNVQFYNGLTWKVGPDTCGGNADGAACSFPFTYGGVSYSQCTTAGHDQLWCYTDKSNHWGHCKCAATSAEYNQVEYKPLFNPDKGFAICAVGA